MFAILITYSVGLMFSIARALNEPYGYDLQDIKLNRIASKYALGVLKAYSCGRLAMKSLIVADHETPEWLEKPVKARCLIPLKPHVRRASMLRTFLNKALYKLRHFFANVATRLANWKVFIPLGIFTAWICFVTFLIRRLDTKEDFPSKHPSCRWWCPYIPLDTSTTAYVSLGLFLMLGFWMNDAYGRYGQGLDLWQTAIRTGIEEVTFQIAIVAKRGLWHKRDRERIFSHLVAIAYTCKLQLRDSRDLSELEGVLSPQDLAAIGEADNMAVHCFNVINAYLNSAFSCDEETCQSGTNPFGESAYTTLFVLWRVEDAFQTCCGIRENKMSQFFTTHLKVFTAFWLALLPLSTVSHDGFFSFLYLIPIGYSIVNLLVMGLELADPFGYDDSDIALNLMCDEIKDAIHSTYKDTIGGHQELVHPSQYSRESFKPKIRKHGWKLIDDDINPTLLKSLQDVFYSFPSVSIAAQTSAILWAIASVSISFGLSFTWDKRKRDSCRFWCSPIDVDSTMLGNIGFALFMMLAFRASDSISRYGDGAEMIYDLEMYLRNFAVATVQAFSDGSFHENDKERIAAHLVQIPLCFRDILLNIDRSSLEQKEGFLSDDDRSKFESKENPIEYLLQTIEAYMLVMDINDQNEISMRKEHHIPPTIRYHLVSIASKIRESISRACGIKRFPVVKNYTSHQRLFMILWLILLPLGMVSETGWFTILWAPIISYGVLGLESLSANLVDPYGHDKMDIPVDELCTNAANTILEALHENSWDCEKLTKPSPLDDEPRIGSILNGREVYHEYTLAHFEKYDNGAYPFGEGSPLMFRGPRQSMKRPSLYAHIICSVPWWVLLGISTWSAIAVVISYLAKTDAGGVRWWESNITISVDVEIYVSFAGKYSFAWS